MARRIVIVGAGAAGTTAAIQARKIDRSSQVFLVTRESEPEYSRCGLPYAFSGIVPSLEALISHPPSFYESVNKIKLVLGTECMKIWPDKKTVEVADTQTGNRKALVYDALVIATGAVPTVPSIKGIEASGVFVVRTLSDIQNLRQYLESRGRTVVIIGAGLVGMEMAEALREKGHRVNIVEVLPEVLPAVLDPDMASIVRERAEHDGVQILRNATADEIVSDQGVKAIVVKNEALRADAVIVATRVKPDVKLAEEAGVQIGDAGGILVDDRMLTNLSDIYAAGDCVETLCSITGRRLLIQLATTAVRQGLVAGANAAGGSETYLPSAGVATTKLFGLEVAWAGLTTETARMLGLSPVSARVTASTRLPYMPDAKEVTVKLLCNPEDRQLIGAQIVGEEHASWRANLASQAMQMKLTVREFRRIETCYAPPLAPVWDPLILAASALERKLEGLGVPT